MPAGRCGCWRACTNWEVKIALDDVGVGPCPLAFLIAASPDIIKIDRSLLRRAVRSRAAERQLHGLIGLCGACSPLRGGGRNRN